MAGPRIDVDAVVSDDHEADQPDLPRCELVLNLLGRKWVIPILVELDAEPRRRQYLFHTLRVSSSRLDPTIQELTRLGLVERTFIPNGRTDGPGLAITDLGRSFLLLVRLRAGPHPAGWSRCREANRCTATAWKRRTSTATRQRSTASSTSCAATSRRSNLSTTSAPTRSTYGIASDVPVANSSRVDRTA